MDKTLIKEIMDYVKYIEVQMDAELGSVRSFEELSKDNEVPKFYFRLKDIYDS